MEIYLEDLENNLRSIGIQIYNDSDLIIITSYYEDDIQMVWEGSFKEVQKAIKFLK